MATAHAVVMLNGAAVRRKAFKANTYGAAYSSASAWASQLAATNPKATWRVTRAD